MMELNDQDIKLIECHLDQQLDETEKATFTQRMANDMDFNAAVKSYENAVLAVKLANEDKITAILKEEQAKLNQAKVIPINKKNPKTVSILRGWLAAASVTILIMASYFVWQNLSKPKMSPLVAAYFEPYPALGIQRGESEKNIKEEALRTYAVNDFRKAIPLLQKAFEIEKDSFFLFYKGIAQLGITETAAAETTLKGLETSSIIPSESIAWYLALTYIESGQKENALPLLQKVGNTEGGNREKAIALLGQLK